MTSAILTRIKQSTTHNDIYDNLLLSIAYFFLFQGTFDPPLSSFYLGPVTLVVVLKIFVVDCFSWWFFPQRLVESGKTISAGDFISDLHTFFYWRAAASTLAAIPAYYALLPYAPHDVRSAAFAFVVCAITAQILVFLMARQNIALFMASKKQISVVHVFCRLLSFFCIIISFIPEIKAGPFVIFLYGSTCCTISSMISTYAVAIEMRELLQGYIASNTHEVMVSLDKTEEKLSSKSHAD